MPSGFRISPTLAREAGRLTAILLACLVLGALAAGAGLFAAGVRIGGVP